MTCQSTQELILQDIFAFYGNQMMTKNGHAAIFEVKFRKTERAVKESRERSAEQLFADLESVASAVEGSDLGPTEDPTEPTASCIYDTQREATGNQIWSSETEMLCIPFPPQAGNEFACCCSRVLRNSASTSVSLQGRCHCGRCQRCSIQVLQKARARRSARFLSCSHAERDATSGQYVTPI